MGYISENDLSMAITMSMSMSMSMICGMQDMRYSVCGMQYAVCYRSLPFLKRQWSMHMSRHRYAVLYGMRCDMWRLIR